MTSETSESPPFTLASVSVLTGGLLAYFSSIGKWLDPPSEVDKEGNLMEKSWCSAGEVDVNVLSPTPEENHLHFVKEQEIQPDDYMYTISKKSRTNRKHETVSAETSLIESAKK